MRLNSFCLSDSTQAELDTAQARDEKLGMLTADADLQASWTREVLACAEQGRQYSKTGKHANPERESLVDDISRSSGTRLE